MIIRETETSAGEDSANKPNAPKAWTTALEAIQARKQEFAAVALKTIREIQSTGVESLARIADCMNKRGESTARRGKWTATAVKRVLESAKAVVA